MPQSGIALGPDETRQQILAAALGNQVGSSGVLFEPADTAGRTYRPGSTSGDTRLNLEDYEVSADSLLLRWLRVNDRVLSIPDSTGVFDDLPESDQRMLQGLGVCACVPLVHDGELTGWIALLGKDSPAVSSQARKVMGHAHEWAARLHEAKTQWLMAARAELVSRSNRLSITGQLAASIAHEVRNPLAAIRSTVQMIRDDDAAPTDHERLLNTVISEVDRVNDVLSHMLVLGRPHTTRQETCDIAEIADSASDFCSAYAKRRGQQIVRTGTEALWVHGDPHELRQVLVNVLINACQASGSQAVVSVETVRESSDSDGPWAIVRVSDRGTGIPARDLPRVFDAFFSTKSDGGGLGLSICRDIVLRHNGKIEIDSTPGVGTTVTAYLPAQ